MDAPDASSVRPEEDDVQSPATNEKLACFRCRQRKIKCDRSTPCAHCVKVGVECSYASGPKPRERRQRVMVSNSYDSKLDSISRKIDQLSQQMSQLSHETHRPGASIPTENQDQFSSSSSFGITPSSSSVISTPNTGVLEHPTTNDSRGGGLNSSSKGEYEGESSLFAHAVFASRFLQNFINSSQNPDVSRDMEAAIEGLRSAVNSGNQQSDTPDKVYPHAHTIPPGSSIRNLPLPPIDKVFACLRMVKDCPQVATSWLGHFMKPSQFHDHFIKVVSPGPASEADLIIVHCGLYWLFCECSKAVSGQEAMKDYDAQASLCQVNLETVLVNFHFHHAATMDLAYALGFACMYCLQNSKISAAWSFVSFAAHTIHALGLQHHKLPMSSEGLEDKERRRDMFWTIYSAEKTLSLRLGRASNFRDQDITLARPVQSRPGDAFLAVLAPAWVNMASIQGRIYDEVYSPGALMQPAHVRTSRARVLAEELKVLMQRAEQVHEQYTASKGHILGLDYHELARRSDRVMGLCFLTLIYRSIAPEKPATSEFCDECVEYARDTLQEHERCVGVINKSQGKPVFLETYINWYIIRSPFIPFIVIFCYVIETSQASDLKHLEALVETLDSISNSHAQSTFSKQRSLFRALYDVACKYIEVKSRDNSTGQVEIPWSTVQQEYATGFAGTASTAIGLGSIDTSAVAQNVPMTVTSHAHSGSMTAEDVGHRDRPDLLQGMIDPLSLHNPVIGDVDMEMDPSGAQLWDWFNKNQSIMRMLEDT